MNEWTKEAQALTAVRLLKCPSCNAEPTERCKNKQGQVTYTPHLHRMKRARDVLEHAVNNPHMDTPVILYRAQYTPPGGYTCAAVGPTEAHAVNALTDKIPGRSVPKKDIRIITFLAIHVLDGAP